jgi:hypothetical protein
MDICGKYVEIRDGKNVYCLLPNDIKSVFCEENAKLWAFAKGHYWEEMMKLDLENDDNQVKYLILHRCHEMTRNLLELYFELYY